MASDDQEKAPISEEPFRAPHWNDNERQVPDLYVNTVKVEVGPSEITMLFGLTDPIHQQDTGKALVRLVTTHDNFMKMMAFMNRRVEFLSYIYAGQPMSVDDLIDRAKEAFPLLSGQPIHPINTEESSEVKLDAE